MDVNTVACDVCGKQKLAANHWWQVFYSHGQMLVTPFADVTVWNPDVMVRFDLCGEQHLMQKINELIKDTKDTKAKAMVIGEWTYSL